MTTTRALTCLFVALAACPSPGRAEEPADLVAKGIAAQLPQDWRVRARWRQDKLVAFLTPGVVQDGFDLFYDPQRQTDLVKQLCPPATDPVWRLIEPGQDIAIEPEVMGKGGLRVSCRATVGKAPAS